MSTGELAALVLTGLGVALNGLVLWVLNGLRSDIRDLRQQVGENSEDIARLEGWRAR